MLPKYSFRYISIYCAEEPEEIEAIFKKLFKFRDEYKICEYQGYATDNTRLKAAREAYRSTLWWQMSQSANIESNFYNDLAIRGISGFSSVESEEQIRRMNELVKKCNWPDIPQFHPIKDLWDDECLAFERDDLLEAKCLLHDGIPFEESLQVEKVSLTPMTIDNYNCVQVKLNYRNISNNSIRFIFNIHLALTANTHPYFFLYPWDCGRGYMYKLKPNQKLTLIDTIFIDDRFRASNIIRLIYPPMAESYYSIDNLKKTNGETTTKQSFNFEELNSNELNSGEKLNKIENRTCPIYQGIKYILDNRDTNDIVIKDSSNYGKYRLVDVSIPNVCKVLIRHSKKLSAIFELSFFTLEPEEVMDVLKRAQVELNKQREVCSIVKSPPLNIIENCLVARFEYEGKIYNEQWYFEKTQEDILPKDKVYAFKVRIDEKLNK
ncbi:MAG: hypothetical protein IPP71_07070 [Bacteroidetes bacterium]|nr:hypothetical protein [Bacteroidota bacterium]